MASSLDKNITTLPSREDPNVERSLLPQDDNACGIRGPDESQIGNGRSNSQVSNHDAAQPAGKSRADQVQLLARRVWMETEHSVKHEGQGAGCPCLRDASVWVGEWGRLFSAGVSGKQFGKARIRLGERRLEDGRKEALRLGVEAVAFETGMNDGIVMGPHCPDLIVVGIISKLISAQRSDAPAAEHAVGHQGLCETAGRRPIHDAGPEGVTGIRGTAFDRPAAVVHADGERRTWCEPECGWE